jgi:hypothetical protein
MKSNAEMAVGSRAGQAVFAALLRDLVSGELPPEARLPTRRELIARFATTPVTVQRALDRLSEAGFIESRGRHGTFVAARPPHRHRIALVFKAAPGQPEWRQFWTVLVHASHRVAAEGFWRFEPYYEVMADTPGPDLARLSHDISEHRIAGAFFASTPRRIAALEKFHIPRVAVTTSAINGLTALVIDHDDFVNKAVDWLAERGCRRVALIAVPGYDGRQLDAYRSRMADHGLRVDERFVQLGYQSLPHWTRNTVDLMFHMKPGARPDGLVVADDNLAASACEGLAAAGLAPGAGVQVVSHANFPALNQKGVSGVQRIGYDNVFILRRALECIQTRIAGGEAPASIAIPACLEAQSHPGGTGSRQKGRT